MKMGHKGILGMGTTWGWGHHGDGEIMGKGTLRDGTQKESGWGHCGDGDIVGMGTTWGWGQPENRDAVGMGHKGSRDGDNLGSLGTQRDPGSRRRCDPMGRGSAPQDADITALPHSGAASAPFTFFRTYKDGLWRFESAANPGWFLCTSARAHQPLALSRRPDASHVLDFYFQLC